MTDLPLRGFGAVVVGGSRGIGAAVAALLAQLGAGVVVNGRDVDAVESTVGAITSAGGHAVGLPGSAADDAIAQALISLCENEFGQINALVNCAGTPEPSGSSILTISPQEFRDLIDVHLGTVFATCRAAAPRMVARGGGSIVNISSDAGRKGSIGQINYAAAKSGMLGITMSAAREWGQYNIRTNSVCFGVVETPMTEVIRGEKFRDGMLAQIPMGRWASPEEVVKTVCFLLSDGASYITGQHLAVNGGYHITI